MRIGYFQHWFQAPYRFTEFLCEQGIEYGRIDYSKPGYLEKYDVALIEQNGFNDYIENDELYIRDWVKRGGICLFLHQDYRRWAPCFLPPELGYIQLIHRYVPTIRGGKEKSVYYNYMMPYPENEGGSLFQFPEAIAPEEMLDWRISVNSFSIVDPPETHRAETVRTAALSCFLPGPDWRILGSYMDPAVRSGALILQGKFGKGMYFLSQILFPEEKVPDDDRCLIFWKKYIRNLLAYFERFRKGAEEPALPAPAPQARKKNCKLAIHMHSLDWYGCDTSVGTIRALMRYMNFDICALAMKDVTPYEGKRQPVDYSDDRVLFLNGQEYHPFNWGDRNSGIGHNNYHMLAIGIDPEAYTQEFTRSLYSDAEIDAYLKRAISYVHAHHGAVCATHPAHVDYWFDYDFDAVDQENLTSLAGSDIERYWLSGRRIAVMNSVDLFGVRRMFDNPAVNFLYLREGETPCRDSVVSAIRAHHTIAAAWFREADITLSGCLPGDEITREEAAGTLHIAAEVAAGVIRNVRLYSGAQVVLSLAPEKKRIDCDLPLHDIVPDSFLRVEIEGDEPGRIAVSTPFFLR